MSDTVSRKALIDWLKDKEQQALEEFERTDRRFCSGEHSAFEDVREKIESGAFSSTESEGEIKSLKAITELAVKGLKDIKLMLDMDHSDYQKYLIWKAACDPLSEIEKLQNE